MRIENYCDRLVIMIIFNAQNNIEVAKKTKKKKIDILHNRVVSVITYSHRAGCSIGKTRKNYCSG